MIDNQIYFAIYDNNSRYRQIDRYIDIWQHMCVFGRMCVYGHICVCVCVWQSVCVWPYTEHLILAECVCIGHKRLYMAIHDLIFDHVSQLRIDGVSILDIFFAGIVDSHRVGWCWPYTVIYDHIQPFMIIYTSIYGLAWLYFWGFHNWRKSPGYINIWLIYGLIGHIIYVHLYGHFMVAPR